MENSSIFIDINALFSFFDKKDKNHKSVSNSLKECNKKFVTSNFILDELITLMKVRKISVNSYKNYVEKIYSGISCQLIRISEDNEKNAWEIMQKYADHEFSFTDCTSFALMKENNITLACSLDRHFYEFGVQVIPEIK